jgi:hypothetical protein
VGARRRGSLGLGGGECGQDLRRVEPQASARTRTDADRAQLGSVLIDPGPVQPKVARKLSGVHEARGRMFRGSSAVGIVTQQLCDALCDLLDRLAGELGGGVAGSPPSTWRG